MCLESGAGTDSPRTPQLTSQRRHSRYIYDTHTVGRGIPTPCTMSPSTLLFAILGVTIAVVVANPPPPGSSTSNTTQRDPPGDRDAVVPDSDDDPMVPSPSILEPSELQDTGAVEFMDAEVDNSLGPISRGNGGRDVIEFPLVPQQQHPNEPGDSPESPPPSSPQPSQSTSEVYIPTEFAALRQQLVDVRLRLARLQSTNRELQRMDGELERMIDETTNSFVSRLRAVADRSASPGDAASVIQAVISAYNEPDQTVEVSSDDDAGNIEDNDDDDGDDEHEPPQQPQQQHEQQQQHEPHHHRRVCLNQPCHHRPRPQSPVMFTSDDDDDDVNQEQHQTPQQPHHQQQQQIPQPGSSRGRGVPRVPLGEINQHTRPLRIARVWSIRPGQSRDGEEEEEGAHQMSPSNASDTENSTPCRRPPILHHCSSRKRRLFPRSRQDGTSSLGEPLPSTSSSTQTASGSSLHETPLRSRSSLSTIHEPRTQMEGQQVPSPPPAEDLEQQQPQQDQLPQRPDNWPFDRTWNPHMYAALLEHQESRSSRRRERGLSVCNHCCATFSHLESGYFSSGRSNDLVMNLASENAREIDNTIQGRPRVVLPHTGWTDPGIDASLRRILSLCRMVLGFLTIYFVRTKGNQAASSCGSNIWLRTYQRLRHDLERENNTMRLLAEANGYPLFNVRIPSRTRSPEPPAPHPAECQICFDLRPTTACYPCGHVFCGPCLTNSGRCPSCRRFISEKMHIYYD